MDNRSLKIFMACALGAGVGALVALQMNPYLWWIGMLVGGLVGYLSYEYEKVSAAIPRAWNRTISWRPDAEYWKNIFGTFAYFLGSVLIWRGTIIFLEQITTNSSQLMVGLVIATLVGCFARFTSSVLLSFLLCAALMDDKKFFNDSGDATIGTAKMIFAFGNPIFVYLGIVIALTVGFWKLLQFIPSVAVMLILGVQKFLLFLKTTFLLIHSEIRLLCGVDAALGAAIGYFAGNALIGALVGGVFGVLNYEIVSKRILKVGPTPNNV